MITNPLAEIGFGYERATNGGDCCKKFTHQSFTQSLYSLMGLIKMPSFQLVIQNWIRKEIVDDDPYDEETFFPNKNGG